MDLTIKMLNNEVLELIKKYTFIRKITRKASIVYFHYYENDDISKKLLYKKLPYRATKDQVIKMIGRIKDEIEYEEIRDFRKIEVKKEIEKPLIFSNR